MMSEGSVFYGTQCSIPLTATQPESSILPNTSQSFDVVSWKGFWPEKMVLQQLPKICFLVVVKLCL